MEQHFFRERKKSDNLLFTESITKILNALEIEKQTDEVLKLADEAVIPISDMKLIVGNLSLGGAPEAGIHKKIGRALMDFFFGNETDTFWQNSTTEYEIRKRILKIKNGIHDFLLRITGQPTKRALEDFCCQKRKYIKEKAERHSKQNICSKCFRSCKTNKHRKRHESMCSKINPVKSYKSKLSRVSSIKLGKAKNEENEIKAKNFCQTGLEVKIIRNKSRGVFTRKLFKKGEFICVYPGDLITPEEAMTREEKYKMEGVGCYQYFFQYQSKKFCYDATAESSHLGRLINHSRENPNIAGKVMSIDKIPRIVFFAKRRIERCEELIYDYGERRKEVLQNLTWL